MRWSPTDFLALTVVLISCALRVSCAPVGTHRSPSPSPSPPHSRPTTPGPGAFNGAHHADFGHVNIHSTQPPGPGHTLHSTHITASIGPSVGLGGQHPQGHGASHFSTYFAGFDANHKWRVDGQSTPSSSSGPGSDQAHFQGAHHFYAGQLDIRDHHYVHKQGAPLPPRQPSQLPYGYPAPPAPDHHHARLPTASGSTFSHPSSGSPRPAYVPMPVPPHLQRNEGSTFSGSHPSSGSPHPMDYVPMPVPPHLQQPNAQRPMPQGSHHQPPPGYASFQLPPGPGPHVIVPLSQNGYYQQDHPYRPQGGIYPSQP